MSDVGGDAVSAVQWEEVVWQVHSAKLQQVDRAVQVRGESINYLLDMCGELQQEDN